MPYKYKCQYGENITYNELNLNGKIEVDETYEGGFGKEQNTPI